MIFTLQLPDKAQLFVKKNQLVDFGDKLYQVQKGKDIHISIASKLQVKPEHIFKHLKKVIGEEIKKGELLATKKGMLTTKKVYSPSSGLIKEVSHVSGEITLSVYDEVKINETETKAAFFKGKIVDIETGFFKIAIENGERFDLKSVTFDGGGEMFYFANESFYFTTSEDEIKGKIIVIDEIKPHIEVKCETLGCAGFLYLRGKMSEDDLPAGVLSKIPDYDTITSLKKKYLLFTKYDEALVVYD